MTIHNFALILIGNKKLIILKVKAIKHELWISSLKFWFLDCYNIYKWKQLKISALDSQLSMNVEQGVVQQGVAQQKSIDTTEKWKKRFVCTFVVKKGYW